MEQNLAVRTRPVQIGYTPQAQAPLVPDWSQLFPSQGEWTETAYLALPDNNRIVELSNRRLVIPEMPTDTHQKIMLRLIQVFLGFLAQRPLGELRFAPLRVRLWPGKFREPDIVFMAAEHTNRISEQYWGVPDLTVEVLSPGTWATDRHEKLYEYAQAGIAEYWIVDCLTAGEESIEIYALQGDQYHPVSRAGRGETAHSRLLDGLEVQVDQIAHV